MGERKARRPWEMDMFYSILELREDTSQDSGPEEPWFSFGGHEFG